MTVSKGGQTRLLIAALSCLIQACASSAKEDKPRFKTEGDAIVDDQTSLRWERNLKTAAISWNDAKSYCSALAIGGHSWRLPTRKELLAMLPAAAKDAMPISLTAKELGWFWTGTDNDADPSLAELCNVSLSCACRDSAKFGDIIRSANCGTGTCFYDEGDIACPAKSSATIEWAGKPPLALHVWCVAS